MVGRRGCQRLERQAVAAAGLARQRPSNRCQGKAGIGAFSEAERTAQRLLGRKDLVDEPQKRARTKPERSATAERFLNHAASVVNERQTAACGRGTMLDGAAWIRRGRHVHGTRAKELKNVTRCCRSKTMRSHFQVTPNAPHLRRGSRFRYLSPLRIPSFPTRSFGDNPLFSRKVQNVFFFFFFNYL